MKKVIAAGGGGFIGGHRVQRLEDERDSNELVYALTSPASGD